MSNVYPERDTQTILRLHFELGDTKVDIEGDPDLVVRQLLTQLSKIYPALDLARKLTFDPDLAKLSEMLVGLVEFDPKELLLIVREAPADESMLITLLGMYIGLD